MEILVKTVLAVSHGGIIKTLLIHLGFGTYKEIRMIGNGGYVKLESDGTEFLYKRSERT